MKCPFCGKHSDSEICPFCGMDKQLAEKIRGTAERFYREGYGAAVAGDLYRAEQLLKKALFYDGQDTRTLNLIGLIYNKTGQIGEALAAWEKSVRIDDRKDNRARTYLEDIYSRETRLNAKKEAVRLYNEALQQAKSGSLDYAVARLKKAGSLNRHNVKVQLLLALCYMELKRYRQALSCLDKASRLDPLHPVIARYRRLIANLAEQGQVDAEDEDVQDVSESHSVRSTLTEPDMNEIFGTSKNRRVRLRNWHQTLGQIGMFIVGAACMFTFFYTLKIPDELIRMRRSTADMKEQVAQMEETTEQMQQDLLKAQQYQYDAEQANVDLNRQVEELTAQLQEAGETDMDDALARAVTTYLNGSYADLAKALLYIDADSLSPDSRTLYDRMKQALAGGAETLYDSGVADFKAAQEAEGDAQTDLLRQAELELSVAVENSEEETNRWYMASYYYGCVRFWQEDYQEALSIAKDLLDRYENYDDYYEMIQTLHDDAEEALESE